MVRVSSWFNLVTRSGPLGRIQRKVGQSEEVLSQGANFPVFCTAQQKYNRLSCRNWLHFTGSYEPVCVFHPIKKAAFAGTERVKSSRSQQPVLELLQAVCSEDFGPFRLDQRTSLFVCFDLGGAPEGYSPSLIYHSAIPPQDSPSGPQSTGAPLTFPSPLPALRWLRRPGKYRQAADRTKLDPGSVQGCRQRHPRADDLHNTPTLTLMQDIPHFPACLNTGVTARPACTLVNSCTHARGKQPPPLLTSTSSPTRPGGWRRLAPDSYSGPQATLQPASEAATERKGVFSHDNSLINWCLNFFWGINRLVWIGKKYPFRQTSFKLTLNEYVALSAHSTSKRLWEMYKYTFKVRN